ncbi:MAG: hypothetical protein Q9179_008006, partial [Wetmoreana sp. 5 TL-2023]
PLPAGDVRANVSATVATSATSLEGTTSQRGERRDPEKDHSEEAKTARTKAAKAQVEKDHGDPLTESDELVPKAAHDARPSNEGK